MFRLSVTLLTAVYATVAADFACICNYNVEQIVYTTPNTNGKLLGYMYEFDCKPAATDAKTPGYVQIYFEHQIGYVERGAGVETQTCPGSIPDSDVLITNIQTTTTTTTTPIPTTTTNTTTTSTPIPTTTTTTSTTPIPTTTTTTTTTRRPTTTTTTTTTPAPTTTTTITTTPRPTTTATTTTTPKPTTTTSTTTLKPVTTTTATTTSRPDTSSSTTTTTPKPTATSTRTSMPSASPDCRHDKADIVFLLDSSFSVGIDNFKKQLQFVRNFTTNYDIGPDKVQVGVVTFATTPTLGFHLNQFNDTTSLLIAIDGVNYTSGGSSTDKALEYVRENSFTDAHGARAAVPQILVFITDGPSYFPIGTANEARILHFRNIKTIAIGVGSEVAMTELNQIGSDAQQVFTVPSFDSLQSIEMDIQSAACGFENIDQTCCESKLADIVFVLDSSGSEGKTNFEKQLQFVSNVTNSFDIGPNKTQVSVVTSGTHAYNAFFLNEYLDKASLQTAIHNISYQGGTSNTADELNFVNTNSFKSLNGGRGGAVTKLLVILTDGQSISVDATHTAAQSLKLRGIKVISVGIGSNVSMTELRQVASDSSHVLSVTDFNALNTISHEIERLACMAPSPCGDKPADIVFLLDDSSSQGADNFQKQLNFITNFVNQFDIGPTDVQVGLVTFGTTAHNEFYFNSYSDKPSLIGAIQSVQYRGGSTATNFALRYAHYYQFAAYNGARVNAARIVIILTDGHSNDPSLTISEAISLKNSMHAQVISIGIGAGVNQLELNAMATDRSHVFTIGNFSILHTLQTEIKEQACGVPKPKQVASIACGKQPADIVFLLDSSASEGYGNFQTQLDFVRDFVYQFTIGPNDVQVSVIVFSNNSHEQFPLNRYHNRVDLLNAIARITYNNGGTYTNKALYMARTESFLASKGARPNAHIVILLTAGHSIHPAVTAREADLLKNQTNMNVIAIGIGSGVNRSELHRIASNNAQALFIADFNSLSAFQSELTFMACKTCTFANKADIVFALDASSSEGALNFHSQLEFVSRVASDFTVGVHNVQIGIVTFSDSAHLEFNLNQYHDKSSLLAAIQKVAYTQGITTHTDEALQFIRQRMFKLAAGDRDHANNYVILITDGASNNRNATIQAANLLKQQNVIFIVIGIGSNINSAELNSIASDPRHLFLVSDFNALRALSEDIKAVACEEVQSTTAASPIHATATVG